MAGYGDDAGFTAWLAEQGETLPAGAASEVVLRQRGSEYIDGRYGRLFSGTPEGGSAQERAWPRTDAYDVFGNVVTGIPDRVVNASYQAALIDANSPGILSRTFTPGERKVLTEIKGIKWTLLSDGGEIGAVPVSTAIEGMLYPLIMPQVVPSVLVV